MNLFEHIPLGRGLSWASYTFLLGTLSEVPSLTLDLTLPGGPDSATYNPRMIDPFHADYRVRSRVQTKNNRTHTQNLYTPTDAPSLFSRVLHRFYRPTNGTQRKIPRENVVGREIWRTHTRIVV
jgi:hypothetical protein